MTPPIIKRYLITLNRHKLIGIASFALITGIAGVFSLSQEPVPEVEPRFQAQGLLKIIAPPTIFSETGGRINESATEEVQLDPETLLTEEVLREAAAVSGAQKPEEFMESLKVEKASDESITVAYEHKQSQVATATVEVLMQNMIKQSYSNNTAQLREIQESIEERLSPAQRELDVVEQELERFRRNEGTALLAAQDGTLVSAITTSEQQQRQLELEIERVRTEISSLEARLGLTADEAYTASALSSDPIISQLRQDIQEAERQIQLSSRDLRPEHPQMVELRKQVDSYEQLLQNRGNEVRGGNGLGEPLAASRIRIDSSLDPARQQIANQLVSLQTQLETLQTSLAVTQRTQDELREQYRNFPNKQLKQGRLEQQVQFKQAFYNQLQAQLQDAKVAEAETSSNLIIAMTPQASEIKQAQQEATSPVIILGGGAFFGLLVAGGLIFLLATLDNTLYTAEEIRKALEERDVPLLGELPSVTVLAPDRSKTGILLNPGSPYLHFYELFRSNLRRLDSQSLKVVLITSTVEEEGKTVSAYNLAIASAQAGKRTLLLEADFRSPSQAGFLKVSADPDARVQPIRYYSPMSGCIRLAPEIENLYIVPSPGPQGQQSVAILESSELRQFIEDARGRFDFVVVDSPALSRCNDALLLEPLTDGMVLVARPGYTQGGILATALDELTETELSPLLGTIINGVDKPAAVSGLRKELGRDYDQEDGYDDEKFTPEGNVATGTSRW